MYLISGDADLGVIKYMVGIFFNKKLEPVDTKERM